MSSGAQKQRSSRYSSPLRYPGGKAKIVNYLKLVISQNDLFGVSYIEPYAGGSSVALSLLFDGFVGRIQINDLNEGIYQFWSHVLGDCSSFCQRIQKTPVTVEEWRKQKLVYANPESSSEDLAFATFFLNRTNRSGIISRGGVIGGVGQRGKWKIDARFNKGALQERLWKIYQQREKIEVSKVDAVELVEKSKELDSPAFFYLDPPYYVKGSQLYDNFYKHEDHLEVARSVSQMQSHWVVSYDAAPQIVEMYEGFNRVFYSLGYSASGSSQGDEVMFFSDSIDVPEVSSPASVKKVPNPLVKMKQKAPTIF